MAFATFSDKTPPWSLTALDGNFAAISAATGSSLVGFTQASAGAAGTIAAKLQQIINAADAPFNVSSSNTAAANTTGINAALAFAKTITGQKTVVLPPGVLNVNGFTPPGTSAISADTNGITLKGAGNGYQQQANPGSGIATTLKFAAGITSGLGSAKTYGIYQDNTKHWMNFEDFGIDGSSAIDYGMRICTQATYRRIRSTNCNGHGFRGQTLDSTECELLVAVGNVGGGILIDKATAQDSVNTTPNTTLYLTGIFSGNGTTGLEIQQLAFSKIRAISQNNLTNGLKSVNQAGVAWMQWCELYLWLENNGNGVNPQILFDSGDASGGPQDNLITARIDPLSTNTSITITKGLRNRFYRTIFTNNATGAVSLAAGATDNVFQDCLFSDGTAIGSNITDVGTRNYLFGEWKTPAFSAGNFTAGGTQTWTVDAGDVVTYEYSVVNKVMTLVFSLNTTSVGGVANTDLRLAIPGGFVGNKSQASMFVYSDNGAAEAFGTAFTAVGVGYITLHKGASIINTNGNWAAAANTTYVYGSITLEVK